MIKVKLNGMKQKIEFLGYNDIITDDCYQTIVSRTGWPNFKERNEEEYNSAIEMFEKDPSLFKNYKWHLTSGKVTGDRVCDMHSHRTYFRVISCAQITKEFFNNVDK